MSHQVLLFSNDIEGARNELARQGGRVLVRLSDVAFVAELPKGFAATQFNLSTTKQPTTLDAATQLAIDAWNSSQPAVPAATEGLPWDTPGYSSPQYLTTQPQFETQGGISLLSTDTPTSRYLTGKVAVGLVIVSRDQGTEQFSRAETTNTIAQVRQALTWLAAEEPLANVEFDLVTTELTVTASPGPDTSVSDPYEQYERGWRDAALIALGYSAGRTGYRQYARDLKQTRNAAWSYVAFFTKYALHHFAYAAGERLVMNYANDNWGPANIHRVFAHETCHVFGAADEYGTCTCGEVHGHLRIPNNNCVNCSGTHQACLMDQNTLSLCTWSSQQIGWNEEILRMQTFMQSIVVGTGANPPNSQGHQDYTFTLGSRVIGGWWSLQEDASSSDAFKQFGIGGTGGSDNNTPTINGNSITFRIDKKDNSPGLIRILFTVLYV